VDLFNRLEILNKSTVEQVFKTDEKIKLIENMKTILKVLDLHIEIIPNYPIDLTNLHQHYFDGSGSSSPKLIQSAIEVQDLTSKVEETGASSPNSDKTIKQDDFYSNLKGKLKDK
jgi:hypothetical protein